MITIFTSSCKDNLTGLEMIAKDVSYNIACDYLQSNKGKIGKLIDCKTMNYNGIEMIKIVYEKRAFYYDENRGYLLGE